MHAVRHPTAAAIHPDVSASREILVVAQHQHRVLLDAIRAGHPTRAEEVAREHARIALLSLEVILAEHRALAELPGGPLLRASV